MAKTKGDLPSKIFSYLFLAIACVLLIIPIYLIIGKSLEQGGIQNYIIVFQKVRIAKNMLNSILVVGLTLIITVLICSPAAFAFSKLNFRGRNILFIILLMGLMIPGSAVLFPVFLITQRMGLIDSPFSLIGPYVAGSSIFGLMMLKIYYDGLPDEIIESARIDGASSFMVLRILFPMSLPGLSLLLINTFNGSWNELMLCITLIHSQDRMTMAAVPLKLKQSLLNIGLITNNWNLIFAVMFLCMIPIVIFYLFSQKMIINGLTAGAVKG